ncbi:hypothetical protein [Methylobacterium sp. AMS5]|uniref:hypothetical protein n=1 Tax=Methylobacterium sp. AMS5 TaxID=925818 RepID=UPI00074FA83E|nr:hypothetical protein [Methylobacterium sp. AMS5]AMB44407.1 hypothetical protein Y590_05820 [Methylobacterium sp. AMS5]
MLEMRDLSVPARGRDDTAALQAGLNRAEGAGLRLEARTYKISDTLLIPSGTILDGAGAVLHSTADDRPILASRAYAGPAPLRGRTRITRLRLEGTGRGPGQHGVVLLDYWSEIAEVEVATVGGRGIVLADRDAADRAPTGTLVENRVRDCAVRGSGRAGIWAGDVANGRLTDGLIRDCIIALAEDAREPALMIGHAAGWTIDGIHTYGGRPERAVDLHQAYFTSLTNLYVESFAQAAVTLAAVQTSVTLSNLNLVAGEVETEAAFLELSAHRDFPTPRVLVSNVALWRERGKPMDAVRIADTRLILDGGPVLVLGPGASGVRRAGLPGADTSGGFGSRSVPFAGRAPQSLVIATADRTEAFQASVVVVVIGRATDGAIVTRWMALASWGRLHPGDPLPQADLLPVLAPEGFIAPPRLKIATESGRLVLKLVFTAAASGPGHVAVA